MKKLVFAAIAAMVMVSVSNVFASGNTSNVSAVVPVDTVAPADTTVSEQPAAQPTEQPAAQTPVQTPADSTVAK